MQWKAAEEATKRQKELERQRNWMQLKAAEEATKGQKAAEKNARQTQARVMQRKAATELKGALHAWGGVTLEEDNECV
jgi:hypothetical protein